MIDKDLLLTDDEWSRVEKKYFAVDNERSGDYFDLMDRLIQAQLDKCKAYYEPLIKKAREEGVREGKKQMLDRLRQPDEIIWLCRPCHKSIHEKEIEQPIANQAKEAQRDADEAILDEIVREVFNLVDCLRTSSDQFKRLRDRNEFVDKVWVELMELKQKYLKVKDER